MGTVPVRDLTMGAVLTADVTDRSGRILLRSGATVDERQLRVLQMWGVTEVEIAGDAAAGRGAGGAAMEDESARAAAETDALFAHANREHPAMQELARLSAARTLRLGKDAGHGS